MQALAASELAGPAHGRGGFFHGVANRAKRQARVDLGGVQALVIQSLPNIGKDRKSTRLNSSHLRLSRMPSSA